MNYVGSISILDRGDAPAQAVIDRNARSLAQRIADETKDELEKVMTRVETIYSSFEDTDQIYGTSNLEYLQDISELEEIMKDQVKKKKYQQQVTIFVVGFSDVCGQKLRLMQQVNEFFMENSKNVDEEDWFPMTPDLDLEEVGEKVDESLQTARDLGKRLGELNQEMIEYMANYAEKKASNKGKKKLEKALAQARDEVQILTEKLMVVQTELEEKDDKLQSTFKQLEIKNLEVQKFRTAAELAKKAVQDTEALQQEIAARDAKLQEQRQRLNKMEMEVAQSSHMQERSHTKLNSLGEESQQKIQQLQKELDEQKQTTDEVKRDLHKFHEEQLTSLREVHQQEMDEMKKQHADQIKTLTGVSETQSEVAKQFDLDSEDGTSRQSSKQESRPSTKDKGKSPGGKKLGTKSPTRKDGKGSRGSKEFAEVAIQDEGGDPSSALIEENKLKTPVTRQSKRSRSTLAPVDEFDDYEDAFDLSDDESWSTVPKDQMQGRFAQYRRISQNKIRQTEEQRQLTIAKTQRKVQLLKAQFVEHKTKWEAERKILIEQVEQAQQLQTDAEKEADQAMTQLEDFITEQEKLEEEEEARRSAILRGRSGSSSLTPGVISPGIKTPVLPATSGGRTSTHPTPPDSRTTHSSEELQNLMQQTDDAKVEELRERLAGTKSAPPGVDTTAASTEDAQKAAAVEKAQTPDAIFKIEADTEDELRDASARSRASLRSHYKNRLEESRNAADDRRTKSPQISVPSKMSIDDELVLDDDDDDLDGDMALPDDIKEELSDQKKDLSMYEMGTSPPPGNGKEPSSHSIHFTSRKASALVDHPMLREYLQTYNGVAAFKETISRLFLDKDMMSASQILSDLETLVFDHNKKVMPQVELFTANCLYILEEIASVIQSAVIIDREPPVSSLLPFSRDEMRKLAPTREASEDIPSTYTHPKMVTPASGSGTDHMFFNANPGADNQAAGAQGPDLPVAMDTGAGEGAAPRRVSIEDAGQEDPPSQTVSRAGSLHGSMAASQAGSVAGSNKSSVSGTTKQYMAELQSQCAMLQKQLEDENKKHEEQLKHNTVVMMEMQDTINELQRELSTIGKSAKKPRSAASSAHGLKTPSPDQSLMFTRLDLERNAKIMKKAVLDQRLDADRYKEAVTTMDDYVSLPSQRLAHLVKKYVHHSRMKEIEENVKKSQNLDEGVFDTLDKMEALQNQRARHWAEKMDSMGMERLRLAAMLMDSLDSIEQESGLFLIKPMYSFRGRELKAPPTQKLARPIRSQPVPRHQSAALSTTSFVPAPTPASNARRTDRHTPTHQGSTVELNTFHPPPTSHLEDGLVGGGAIRNIITPQTTHFMQNYQTWNMSASQARSPLDSFQQNSLNTPRMLELDINRMLIGQNNIHTKLPHPPTDDRLINANNNSLRSYVTVQRPTASLSGERPASSHGGRDTAAPPSSPSPRPAVPVSPADRELPQTMTSPTPLPPISDRPTSAASSNLDDPEPPRSPPGSSTYQSTNHDVDEFKVKLGKTRASSEHTSHSLSDAEDEDEEEMDHMQEPAEEMIEDA